jgi:hypothetical protein
MLNKFHMDSICPTTLAKVGAESEKYDAFESSPANGT